MARGQPSPPHPPVVPTQRHDTLTFWHWPPGSVHRGLALCPGPGFPGGPGWGGDWADGQGARLTEPQRLPCHLAKSSGSREQFAQVSSSLFGWPLPRGRRPAWHALGLSTKPSLSPIPALCFSRKICPRGELPVWLDSCSQAVCLRYTGATDCQPGVSRLRSWVCDIPQRCVTG